MDRLGGLVVLGAIIAVLSLGAVAMAITSMRASSSAARVANAETSAQTASSVPALGIAGGLGLAVGGALIGIGMGRWKRPRRARDEKEFTGPGTVDHSGGPPDVV